MVATDEETGSVYTSDKTWGGTYCRSPDRLGLYRYPHMRVGRPQDAPGPAMSGDAGVLI